VNVRVRGDMRKYSISILVWRHIEANTAPPDKIWVRLWRERQASSLCKEGADYIA
jgi:hypothetical protein